jgi:selenide,water dikinase
MKIVLIGGGHSHAIALKLFSENYHSNINLTLISDTEKTPYSGMLPGHIAGYYSFEETHIDLIPLAKLAKANLYLEKATQLDIRNNQVILANNNLIDFNILSIDIGSTPAKNKIKGAEKYAIPAKPVPYLLEKWNYLLKNINLYQDKFLNIIIIGGGAGGVELALNMQTHLSNLLPLKQFQINLFQRGKTLLPSHNSLVKLELKKLLKKRNIQVYLEENVKEILADQIICESGLKIESNYTFLVTQASPQKWLQKSGLVTDNKGFILIKNTLQSISHPHIFATGDVATMVNCSYPKAGVFAVRQGKPLYHNLVQMSMGKSLKNYIPQKKYLSLIGTGDKKAIASWGNLGGKSSLFWIWKDYIDRQFMNYIKGNG